MGDRIRERLHQARLLYRDDPDMTDARIVLAVFLAEAEALLEAARGTAAEPFTRRFRDALAQAYKDAALEIAGRLS